jgi:DNA ligase-1
MKNFRPILGTTAKLDQIKFPCLVSTKLDGIRCLTIDGELKSRSLKPIRNKYLQQRYKLMCAFMDVNDGILDGELFSPELTFQEITSYVMSEDKEPPEHLKFYAFDMFDKKFPEVKFSNRYKVYTKIAETFGINHLEQKEVNNIEELQSMFKAALEEGNEGLIIRSPDMPYKFGRSTIKEGSLLKMKPFETFDGIIKGVIERMENTSESYTNELGHSQKHRCKDDFVPTGIASAFVIDWYPSEEGKEPVEMKVTLTGTEDFRRSVWTNKEEYIGKWVEFKAMNLGIKEALRHPTYIRMRGEK